MLKLIKYEFRKSLTSFLTMLGLTAALEAYFLIALKTRQEDQLLIALALLVLCVYAAAVYVFVRGVVSYAGELKSRSAYLVFMTPNTTLKIMGSKFLYTFVNGLMMMAIFLALAALDGSLAIKEFNEYETFWGAINRVLTLYGIHVDQAALGTAAVMGYMLLSLLSVIALSYLAITLSHTLFRNKKWRSWAALAIFLALNYFIRRLNGLFPSAMDQLIVYSDAMDTELALATMGNVLHDLIPAALISVATVILSLFGCAWMLDWKVSL